MTNMKFKFLNSVLAIFVLALLHTQSNARTSEFLKVTLNHGGTLVGRHLTSHYGRHMRAFMGIPYAKPPVGNLRFKPPVPYGPWKGEKQVIADSEKCTQRDPFRRDTLIEGSEDCLYLNVYTPEVAHVKGELLPVMVWFHGGGWECGSGIAEFYGPNFLLDHDIILISANFRLGPLGFLSTETEDCPGNFGLKDQLEVLKWVQMHIRSFGGNPNSVTIFGESAGGASVTYHMLSDKSKGLFHKGIAQSGTYFNPWAQPAHKGVAAKRARKLAELVGCTPFENWQEMLACIRQRPAEDVVATIYDLFEWDYDPMIPFPPVVEPAHDGAFLKVLPRTAEQPHGFSMPLMIGVTTDEGLLRTAALLNLPGLLDDFKMKFNKVLPIILNYDHHAERTVKEITNDLEKFYFKKGHNYNKQNHQNFTDLISDGWFVAGIDEYIRLRLNKSKADTFVYLFDQKGSASFTEIFEGGAEDYYGVCHAEELQYLFPIGHELFVSSSPTPNEVHLREAMLKMWVNFANASDPTPFNNEWKPATKYPPNYMRLGSKKDDNWSLLSAERGLFQDRVDFWANLKPHIPAQDRQERVEL